MLLVNAALLTSALLALRSGAHALILHGLRAPRLAHLTTPAALGLAAQPVRLPTAGGKTLFAWFVSAPDGAQAPAVLVMHGWGANASLMLPAVAPLQAAGLPGAMPCLAVPGGHDPSDALDEYLPQLVEFLQQSCAAAPSH
jgi:hypothetical protein